MQPPALGKKTTKLMFGFTDDDDEEAGDFDND